MTMTTKSSSLFGENTRPPSERANKSRHHAPLPLLLVAHSVASLRHRWPAAPGRLAALAVASLGPAETLPRCSAVAWEWEWVLEACLLDQA